MTDTPLTGFGFTVLLPDGWEGRIFRRPTPGDAFTPANRASADPDVGADGWLGERPRAVVHLANFPLPPDRGDYGSGAVELMDERHCFISLVEFGGECRGTALYGSVGVPRPQPQQFGPNALARRIAGQTGVQLFFTESSRPLCLYVVLGSDRDVPTSCSRVNQVLDRVTVT